MRRLVEQPPVQAVRVGPLGLLGELAAHEEQLLARVRPHGREVGPHVGQLLPAVAGHLAQQRALAVHDLVVADRQHEVLAPGVHQRERHLVVVPLAVDRLVLHVLQRVVHPAHVPLQAEAEAAQVGRPGHARPRGRLLGDGHDARARACTASRSSPAAAAPPPGSPGRRTRSAATRRPCASSRGRASRRRRRPAGRRRGTPRTSRARWPPGSCAPAGGRSRRCACPSPAGRRAAGPGARRAARRRSGPARRRPWGSAPAPSPGSRRSRRCAGCRRGGGSRPVTRTARSGA